MIYYFSPEQPKLMDAGFLTNTYRDAIATISLVISVISFLWSFKKSGKDESKKGVNAANFASTVDLRPANHKSEGLFSDRQFINDVGPMFKASIISAFFTYGSLLFISAESTVYVVMCFIKNSIILFTVVLMLYFFGSKWTFNRKLYYRTSASLWLSIAGLIYFSKEIDVIKIHSQNNLFEDVLFTDMYIMIKVLWSVGLIIGVLSFLSWVGSLWTD